MSIYIVIRLFDSGAMDEESIRSFGSRAAAEVYRNELCELYPFSDIEIIESDLEN